jgi:Family of unknown function (DUF6182)
VSTPADRTRPSTLRELFDERDRLVRSGLRSPAEAETPADVTVLVVLRAFDLTALVRGATRFAVDLTPAEADGWYRSWTRTRFMFGHPNNLSGRTAPRVLAGDAAMAWLGPYPAQHPPGLARLLKPVSGALPALPAQIEIPGRAGGAPWVLRVACRGLTVPNYLIHVHHTLAEAVLLGRLDPDASLLLAHDDDLDLTGLPRAGYVRVHHDSADGVHEGDDPEQPGLRAYTHLSGTILSGANG